MLAVEVKGWHTERFTPGYFKSWPTLMDFASSNAASALVELVGPRPIEHMLVVGAANTASVDAAATRYGVRVVEFEAVLRALIAKKDLARHSSSEAAHTLRVLQRYGFLAEPAR